MPEKLVDENVIDLYKDGMASMRLTLGRRIIIKLPPVARTCPNCSWDDVNKTSSGIHDPEYPYPSDVPGPKPFKGRCPVCKGVGKIDSVVRIKRVKGLCYWLKGEDRKVTVAGITYNVDIEASNIDIRYYALFENAASFIVDGQEVELAFKPLKEGLRDLIKFTAYFTFSEDSSE